MINVEKIADIAKKLNMTVTQIFIVHCVNTEKFKELNKYLKLNNRLKNSALDNLIRRDIILYTGDKKKLEVKDLYLDDKTKAKIYIDYEAGEEFFKVYPSFIEVDGKSIIAKKCDKDLYVEKYVQHINFDMEKHNNIIAGLKIAKERHLITVAIRNFIDSEMYDILLELKEQFGSKTGVSDSEAI